LEFIRGGPNFFYAITDKKRLPEIIKLQIGYVEQAKRPAFDPRETIIQKFPATLIVHKHIPQDFLCLGVVLTYNSRADPEYYVGIIADPNEQTIVECTALLSDLKKNHNLIHKHEPFDADDRRFSLVYTTNTRQDERVTKREAEVLDLLSKGFSTKEIAGKLQISFHTTEGYRKNLLEKFEAKNSAELIKKASKVFWLE
jgi:DNA-binding NarL/FixJ family response regulator